MKKIIVPVDFSEYSEYALEAAANLVGQNGEILVLHMLELSDALVTKSVEGPEVIYFLRLAEQRFKDFLNKPYLKNVKVTPVVKHYKVFSEVNDLIDEHNVDLIVMGSHGASGFKEFFIGSNTEKLVRVSKVPVLVLKNRVKIANIDSVVFACSFDKEAEETYRTAMDFFSSLGIRVFLLYVNLPNDGFLSTNQIDAKIEKFLMEADGNLDRLVDVAFISDYTIENGILNFSNKVDADLIALATHGRRGISRFFNGSIGEDLANHATLPVLTFRL